MTNEKQNENDKQEEHPVFGNLIYSYTRADAIRDGVLIDLTPISKLSAIRSPTAITATAYGALTASAEEEQEKVLRIRAMFSRFLRAAIDEEGDTVFFTAKAGDDQVELKALCGPGDTFDPVITIMFPHED